MPENPYKSPQMEEGPKASQPNPHESLLFTWLFRDCPRMVTFAIAIAAPFVLIILRMIYEWLIQF